MATVRIELLINYCMHTTYFSSMHIMLLVIEYAY